MSYQNAVQEKTEQIEALCQHLGIPVKVIEIGLGGSDDVHVQVNINSGGYSLLENDEYYKNWTFQEKDDKGRKVGWFLCRMDGATANIQNIVSSMVQDGISIRRIVVSPHSISKLLKENKI